jgi:hypothetical protein
MWQVVEWRNGKCVSWQTFRREADAVEDAGLSGDRISREVDEER